MDTFTPGQEEHNEMLRKLRRKCAGFLKKCSDTYERSHPCDEKNEFLREKFGLNVSNDEPEIHPTRFCNLCYLFPTRVEGPVFWHVHTDENCVMCSFAKEKMKDGRPKKVKRGSSYLERRSTTLRPKAKKFKRSVQYLISCSFPVFSSQRQSRKTFYCPVCKNVVCQPVETVCEHYYCGLCLKDVMLNSGIPFNCTVCKTQLNATEQMKRPSRMVLTLIAELKVKCTDCGGEFSYEGQNNHFCAKSVDEPAQPGQNPVVEAEPLNPIPGPAGDPLMAVTLEEAMEDLRQGKISPEVEKMGTLFVKSKLKTSADGKTAPLKTHGKVLLINNVKKVHSCN